MDDAGTTGRARRAGRLALLLMVLAVLAGCGNDDTPDSESATASSTDERPAAMADAAGIRQRIIGNTVTGTMSPESAYTEYYAPNGDIRGASYQAVWTIEDDSLCFDYDESPQIDCYRVRIDGDAVEWHRQGEIQGRGTIVEGNPNNF